MEKNIKTGDLVSFTSVGNGQVTIGIPPMPMSGSGKHSLKMMPGAVEGDEGNVTGMGMYMPSGHQIPGMAMIKIKKLHSDQLSEITAVGGKPPIILGSEYETELTPTVPAQKIAGTATIPDSTPKYSGKGKFTVPVDAGVEDKG